VYNCEIFSVKNEISDDTYQNAEYINHSGCQPEMPMNRAILKHE